MKEFISDSSITKNIHTFVKNFDLSYFLNKILMARIEK